MLKHSKTLKFRTYEDFRQWYMYITSKYTHLKARLLSSVSGVSAVVVIIMY